MPNTKISALTLGDPAQGTDQIPVARAGTNVKLTAASIAALSPSGTVTSVGLSGGTTGLTVSGTNPITASGTFTLAGTLAIANGGTGATTKTNAFNALQPMTALGDMIYANSATTATYLPIGTNGYYLQSNGTTPSWQPLSVSAGSISGTLQPYQGGTGTTSSPTNGQLLIGSFGGYATANLTAGSGVTITNGAGSITIAASGGGGPTISVLGLSTTSGSFNNSPPSSSVSKPLIGYATSPSNYGAFFFKNFNTGSLVTSASINSISVLDSTGASTSYASGPDFSGSPSSFSVYDSIVTCYGLLINNTGLRTLFSTSKAAITSPSLAPLDASNGFSFTNPGISVSTSGSTYTNASGQRGIVVSKSGSNYFLEFASADTTSAFPTVNSIAFTINGSPSSYSSGSDFSVSFAQNSANGQFTMQMTPTNGTLTTLLNNSFL